MVQKCYHFSVDSSSSLHTDNRKKDILVIGKAPTNGLDKAAKAVEAKYSFYINKFRRKICLSLQYNEANRFLYANGEKSNNSQQKGLRNKPIPIVLGEYFKVCFSR